MCYNELSSPSFTDGVECRYVLPQHYLLQLAEKPPTDLPALLSIFRSVPPVIKRRANELLGEIRTAGSRNLDFDWSRKAATSFGQPEGSKTMKVFQSDIHNESGRVPQPPRIEMYLLIAIVQGLLNGLLFRHTHSSACVTYHTRRQTVYSWALTFHRSVEIPEAKLN
jgi:hypothetical protein